MIKKFNRIEEGFLIATLVLMVALIFGQVIGRYIFQNAPSWTEEAARYIHIFQVWIGAGYAVKLREHIKVSALIDLFHGMTRKVLDMVALIIWFLMVLLVAIFGTELVMTTLQYGQVAPATQIPFWLPYLAVPLGALSMMIRLILQMIEIIKKDYDKPGEAAS
ncbi:TRAP transporter small permease [Salinicoccus roseus]|uniref:TRAP transporter small permease n=1 Tax=Salinicoccus roseus TaxID=45670 RepID=UPI001CA67565|nr:TRAP transporter small permease [Salinicoccus roseus]MBY8908665.1 TRAP transporter small permease [Salinicoccus roseus]